MSFDEWVADLRDLIRRVGEDSFDSPDDDWMAMCFAMTIDGNPLMVPLPMEMFAPEMKQVLYMALTALLREFKADRAAMLSSTWYVEAPPGTTDPEAFRASLPPCLGDYPGRKEMLVVVAADIAHEEMWTAPITRGGPTPELGEWELVKGADGNLIAAMREAVSAA